MKEEIDREVFFSKHSRHFSMIGNMIKVLYLICTLIWRVNNYVSSQVKGINRRNESTIINIWFCSLWYCNNFLEKRWLFTLIETFSLIIRGDIRLCYKIKNQFSLHNWQNCSLTIMATLRNKGKLAAHSIETPERTRNNQSENTPNPGMTEEYITQVSEEIEGRITKKLSIEFSLTE